VVIYLTTTRPKKSKTSTKSCRKVLLSLLPCCPLIHRLARVSTLVPMCQWVCYIYLMLRVFLTVSTTLKLTDDDSSKEFRLSDVTSSDGDIPQVEPTPQGGLLTPQSQTLGTATLDSDMGPPVSDMELFFTKFKNKEGVLMRWCNKCV